MQHASRCRYLAKGDINVPLHKIKIPETIGDFTFQCAGEDLNLHVLRHTHLKRACLPIPAPAQLQSAA